MNVINSDNFFPGFSEKQFFLFFISEDPWQYLRNFKIPNELTILSGLRGFKRKREDIETLIISDKFSWLTTHNSDFSVCHELFRESIKKGEIDVPIPYLKGGIEKNEIKIIRDKLNYHPLYYSRLPDGFVLSPRKEWIVKLGYKPNCILNKNYITITQESIKLNNIKNTKHSHGLNESKEDLLELFLNNIIHAYNELRRKAERVYLVPTGDVGDLVLINLLGDDIEVLWPFKQTETILNFNYYYVDFDNILRNKEEIYSKLIDKVENLDNSVLFPALLLEVFKKDINLSEKSLIIIGLGLEFNNQDELIRMLNNLFKAIWPTLAIPIILSGVNIEILKQRKIIPKDISNYLNIKENIVLKYQSLF